MARYCIGLIVCLALAACPPPPGPAPAAPLAEPDAAAPGAPAAPAEEEIRVCVVTPEGELREVAGTFRPATGDTLIAGRPFREVHSPEEPQYAARHPWLHTGEPILTLNYRYLQSGVLRPVEARQLTRIAFYRGVPVFVENAPGNPPNRVWLPMRPGCEMQPYNLGGTWLRHPGPSPWPYPSPIPEGDRWFAGVALGFTYTCALSTGGDVYCRGEIETDPEERENDAASDAEVRAAAAGGIRFTAITAGAAHVCALNAAGRAYCSGVNWQGQLGDGTTTTRYTPAPVAGTLRFTTLAAGGSFTCGLTREGRTYCWGWQVDDALAGGPARDRSRPAALTGNLRFASLSAGGAHSCGLTQDGRAYCWGDNFRGQLGNGTFERWGAPTPVAGGLRFASISAGGAHSCGITGDGQAYCWGWNRQAQLGDGSLDNHFLPVAVAGGLRFASISAGGGYACFLTEDGEVCSTTDDQHTCALTTEGEAYCWGRNGYGQLGDGSLDDRQTPVAVAGDLRFTAIATGRTHSCGLSAEGALYCWGLSDYGQATIDGYYREMPTRLYRPAH